MQLSANACVWICWRWGTFTGVEWATMGNFIENQCGVGEAEMEDLI